MSSDDEVQVVVPWDAPPLSMQPPALLPAIAVDSRIVGQEAVASLAKGSVK
jgi:hypothetical protein